MKKASGPQPNEVICTNCILFIVDCSLYFAVHFAAFMILFGYDHCDRKCVSLISTSLSLTISSVMTLMPISLSILEILCCMSGSL